MEGAKISLPHGIIKAEGVMCHVENQKSQG